MDMPPIGKAAAAIAAITAHRATNVIASAPSPRPLLRGMMSAQYSMRAPDSSPARLANLRYTPQAEHIQQPPESSEQIDQARHYFSTLTWGACKDSHMATKRSTAPQQHTHFAAVKLERNLAQVNRSQVQNVLIRDIEIHSNWLPAISNLKILEAPDEFCRLISITTRGRFGIGNRAALAEVSMVQTAESTAVLIKQLPAADIRNQRYRGAIKHKQLKEFETLIEFATDSKRSSGTTVSYYSRIDPNAPLPRRLMTGETLKNNQIFIDNLVMFFNK